MVHSRQDGVRRGARGFSTLKRRTTRPSTRTHGSGVHAGNAGRVCDSRQQRAGTVAVKDEEGAYQRKEDERRHHLEPRQLHGTGTAEPVMDARNFGFCLVASQ